MAVYRVYVEKSPEYAVEAQGLLKEIRHILLIKSVTACACSTATTWRASSRRAV